MATAEEIIVKLTAQTAQLKAGMAEGAAVVKETQDAMAASMATSMNAFRQFDDITKQSVQSTEGLAAAQKALDAARASGAFTTEELAVKEALVADAMRKVGSETQAASGALSMFTRNSRTMYSTSALITDAMTGQFSRMRREVAALGNETGLMAQAFRFAISPIGLVTAALAAVAAMAVHAHDAMRELQGGLEVTGNAAKLTKPDLDEMSAAMQTAGLSAGRASDALKAIVGSGKFTASEFVDVGVAAGSMADMTGTSVDKVVGSLESMASGSAASIAKVNEKYNFLSVAQAKQIKDLIDEGHNAEAAAMAYRDLAAAMQGRDADFNKSGNLFDKWVGKEGQFWSAMFHGGDQANDDAKSKLGSLAEALNQMAQNSGAVWQKAADGTIKVANAGRLTTAGLQQANAYLARYNALTKQIADSTGRITDNTNNANKAIESANAVLGAKSHKKGGMSGLEEQFKEQEAAAHASYDQMKVDAADFWNAQANDAKNSAAVQAEAYQKYIAARHQLDEQGLRNEAEADRAAQESSRKAAEIAKQTAEGRARAEEQASQEIQTEIKQESMARRQAALTDAQTARTIADAKIAKAKQDAQTEFDQGKISAAQLLQIQNDLVQQKLAAEVAYLKAKEVLDQGDVNAEKQDAAQITAARLKAQTEQSANLDKSLKQDEQKWKQYSQRIAGAMQNAVNAMIFQHQTLRNSLASIGESIAETFVEAVVNKPLQTFIAGEAQKLAAAIGFGTQKSAADAAQRAANTSADIADKAAASARGVGLAGVNALASFAGAPWPIDMGAPAFAALMMAEAASFGAIASAAGGWERVPADGMMTQLHKNEMVLPARIAEPMRRMAKNGGNGGGSATYNINALDSRSLLSALKRNPRALSAALAHAGRNGW